MTDQIEALLEEQDEYSPQTMEEEGAKDPKMLWSGQGAVGLYSLSGTVQTDENTGQHRASAVETQPVEEGKATLFEGLETGKSNESIAFYQIAHPVTSALSPLPELDGVWRAKAVAQGAGLGMGQSLHRRLRRVEAAAVHREQRGETRAPEKLAAEGASLLELDAAVQRDARRYDSGYELF